MSFLLVGMTAFSQKVVDFEVSSCERDSYPMFSRNNRLIKKELKNDTLILQLGIVRNCNYSPSAGFSYIGDTLFIDLSNLSDYYATCDCCYELSFRILGVPDTNFILGQKFTLVDFVDNEFKEWTSFSEYNYFKNKFFFPTLEEVEAITEYNQLNADSLKIGWWIEYSQRYINNYSKVFYFIDESGKSREKWSIDYNEKNEIIHASALTGFDSQGIANRYSIEGKMYLNIMSTKQ